MPLSSPVDSLGHGERWDSGDKTQRGRRHNEAKDEGRWESERGKVKDTPPSTRWGTRGLGRKVLDPGRGKGRDTWR